MNLTTTTTMQNRRKAEIVAEGVPFSCSTVRTVPVLNRGTFALPMTLRFTEYKAVMVRIPASRLEILSLVLSMPVAAPGKESCNRREEGSYQRHVSLQSGNLAAMASAHRETSVYC